MLVHECSLDGDAALLVAGRCWLRSVVSDSEGSSEARTRTFLQSLRFGRLLRRISSGRDGDRATGMLMVSRRATTRLNVELLGQFVVVLIAVFS